MTVAATITSIQLPCNGSTTQFSFGNKIFQASDLQVTLYDASGNPYTFTNQANVVLGLSYTVRNVDVDTGCLLVFNSPPANTWTLDIRTATPQTQSTSIKNQGAFLPELHEEAFDRITRVVQDLKRQTYIFGIHGLDVETVPWPALPLPAARKGMGLIFDPVTGLPVPGTLSASPVTATLIGSLIFPQSAGELAAGVTPTFYQYPPGHAVRYGADPSGVADSTTALNQSLLQSYQTQGASAYWPEGTYLISTLAITGATRIRTDGYLTKLQQTTGLVDTPVISLSSVSNVEIDPLTVTGNIATDTGEFHHCVTVGASCSHIFIRGVRGNAIRGDVVNIAGTAAGPSFDVKVGQVDGTNIYRNVLSCTGAEGVEIDSIQGTQVGYRHFDMEPNASSQAPTGIRLKYLRGPNAQFAGGNLAGGQGVIRIDYADLDNGLLANSSPGYPSHPSASGNIGIIHGDTQSLWIGTLRARAYQERLFASSANTISNVSIVIDNADISNCNTTEGTFLTLFNLDVKATLEIKNGAIVLAGITRYIVKGNAGIYRLRNLAISGGCVASTGTNCEFENLAINANTVTGNLFASVNKSLFKNCVFTSDGSATTQTLSSDNTFIGCSLAPSAFSTSGGTHNLLKTTLNGNLYHCNALETAVAYNPGAITAGSTLQTTVTVNGAVLGDFAVASFLDTPTGYATVTWQAGVTAANTVTVTARNTGGATVTFANNTLRASVLKKMT